MKKYNTIKKPISIEEKRLRVEDFNKMVDLGFESGPKYDVEEFIKREIFEETVEMKCLDCGYSEIMEYDFLAEIEEMDNLEYPELHCMECNDGTMVPIDIYNNKKQ